MNQTLPIEINVTITTRNGFPTLDLRRQVTSNKELSRLIISAALSDKPLVIVPRFNNKIRSIASLIDKGVLYINPEDGNYYFVEE